MRETGLFGLAAVDGSVDGATSGGRGGRLAFQHDRHTGTHEHSHRHGSVVHSHGHAHNADREHELHDHDAALAAGVVSVSDPDGVDVYLADVHSRGRALGSGGVTGKILNGEILALAQVSDTDADGEMLGSGHDANCLPNCTVDHGAWSAATPVASEVDRLSKLYRSIVGGPFRETPLSGSGLSTAAW